MLSRRKETKQIKHSKNEENFQVFSHRGYTWHFNDLMATKLLSLKLFFDLAQLSAAMCPISDSEVPFPVLVRGACPRKTNHILSSPFTVALATGWERFQTTSNPSFSTKKKIDSQSLHVATGIAQLKGASSKASWLPNPLSSNNNYLCQGSCLCFLYFACMYIKNNFLTLLQSHFWKFCFVQIDIPRFRIFRHSAS